MREKELIDVTQTSHAVIFGVSAGAINMAKHSVDILESIDAYDGLDLADITVKAHVNKDDDELIGKLMRVSTKNHIPVYAMEDESAIFVAGNDIVYVGNIYLISGDKIKKIHSR